MQTSHSVARRLYLVIATAEMFTGLFLYLFPPLYVSPGVQMPGLTPHILAWSLVISAFFVLAAAEPSYPRSLRNCFGWSASLPLVWLAVGSAIQGSWPSTVFYTLMAVALFLPGDSADRVSLEQWTSVLQGGMALALVVNPWAMDPLPRLAQVAAILCGLLAAFLPRLLGAYGRPEERAEVNPVLLLPLPLLLTYGYLLQGRWPLAVAWSALAVFLVATKDAMWAESFTGPIAQESPDHRRVFPGDLERILVIWLWVLGVGVAFLTALAGDGAIASVPIVALFLLAVYTYLVGSTLRSGRFASASFRVTAHFAFAAIALSVLLTDPGPMGHFFLAPLGAALALCLPAVGYRAARLSAILSGMLLICGNLHDWLLDGRPFGVTLSQSLIEVGILAAAVEMGVRVGASQQRLLQSNNAAKQEAERHARRMALINRINHITSASLDPEEILRTAAVELSAALETHGCVIHPGTGRVAATAWPPKPASDPTGGCSLTEIGQRLEGRPLTVTDLSCSPEANRLPAGLHANLVQQGVRAALLVPILGNDRLLGIVLLLHRIPREWTAEDVLFAEGVTNGLAVGLLNAAMHQELVQSHDDLQAAQEELQAQNEELQAQNEALQCQQEALENQQHQLEAALEAARQSEERFRSAFEHAPIGMGMVGPDSTLLQVNQSLCQIFGYSRDELLGASYRQLTHPDDLAKSTVQIRQLLEGTLESYTMEKRYLHKDGHVIWALLSVSSIRDGSRTPIYRIIQLVDITDRKASEAQLMHLARFDPLTDLLNRRGFQEEIDRHLTEAAHQGYEGALVYMDLDQFKFINDTMGHEAGDILLQGVARVIQRQLRPGDPVSRLGGDEFAAFLPNASPETAREVGNRVLEAVRRHVEVIAGRRVNTTASIGLAFYPQDGRTSQELLAKADLAMYLAKDSGRNRLYSSDPGSPDQERMESKLSWEQRIREALEQDRFVLHWQPIRNLRNNQTRQYELLLRMIDENGQVIPPGAFLDTAERFGLIHAIDRWVVNRAITLLGEYQRAGIDLCLEVNLSGRAFEDEQLLTIIREKIAATGINPQNLILEITETAAIKDISAAGRFIDTLRDLGCRFAIDDFGTGFASLYYVKRLAVDYVKIDGSFIANLAKDPVDQHLVRAIVNVARGLGKLTVAEFVGDEETVQLLQEYGVDFAQGYHIGRPRPLEENEFGRLAGPAGQNQ